MSCMNSIEKENNKGCALDMQLLSDIKTKKLLFYDSNIPRNHNYSRSYKGVFTWDIDELNNTLEDLNIENTDIIHFLNPPEDFSVEETEAILNGDLNSLVIAMTLLSNNYSWVTEEIRDYVYKKQLRKDPSLLLSPKFLFTKEEEITFLLGRDLLITLNKTENSEYITELIREIDNLICLFNQGLIGKIALRYNHIVSHSDLLQEGRVGILKALEHYDVRREVKFSTYASHWINQRINRYCIYNREASVIKHTPRLHNSIIKFSNIKEKLEKEKKGDITNEEVLDYCRENNIQLISKDRLLGALKQRDMLSLDQQLREHKNEEVGASLIDTLPIPSEDVIDIVSKREHSDILKKIMEHAGLTKRQKTVLYLRYGFVPAYQNTVRDFYTLEEIANNWGVTRERIRQIEAAGLTKLQKAISRMQYENPF